MIQAAFPQAQGIYVFGSYGTPFFGPESDIDIAVLLPHDTVVQPAGNWAELRTDLAMTLGREIDLISVRTVNTILQFQVIEHGTRIAAPDLTACGLFEVQVYKMYLELRNWRAPIIAAGIEKGMFYDHR